MKTYACVLVFLLGCQCFAQQIGNEADLRNGKLYWTVTLDSMKWMAQNINYKTSESYCLYDNEKNCDNFGRLYSKKAASKACPDGWHASTWDDWVKLQEIMNKMFSDNKDFLIKNEETGKFEVTWVLPLLYRGWIPNPDEDGNTMIAPFLSFYNQSNFSAIPAGLKDGNEYVYIPNSVYFWVMGSNPIRTDPLFVRLNDNQKIFGSRIDIIEVDADNVAASVRCVRNQ